LPADIVKIDQSFVRNLANDLKGQTLVRHLIEMSQGLGFRVVAEGVENREAYDLLRSWQCEEAQGYWMSRPLSPAALQTWLEVRTATLHKAA
jgi:EAL domain-containing protein (putative c-di-GMP-specific phosphodiesterase class I)